MQTNAGNSVSIKDFKVNRFNSINREKYEERKRNLLFMWQRAK
jgi:hypothetical protein